MGYADRDYFRDHATRPPGRLAGAPVVKWLLFLNLAVFVIQVVFEVAEPFVAWGGFTVEGGLQNLQLWRLISFQFLHDDFGHLLFNSFGLFLFGSFVEEAFRSRGFLVFYLVCGVFGALAGALLGVIVATCTGMRWEPRPEYSEPSRWQRRQLRMTSCACGFPRSLCPCGGWRSSSWCSG